MNKSILITGVTGFIGKNIAEQAKLKGYRVLGTVSNEAKKAEGLAVCDEVFVFNLLSQDLPEILSPIDVIVHCIIDVDKPEASIERTIKLNDYLVNGRKSNVIFISSISMNEANTSHYSKIKLALEQYFSQDKMSLILRPGLVLGEGGLYLKMKNFVKNGKIIPLPDGGKYKMAVISIELFIKYLFRSIEEKRTGVKTLYEAELVSLSEIIKNIAKNLNKKVIIFYIPIFLVEWISPIVIRVLNLIHVKISFDSIVGYKLYRNMKLPKSDLDLT